MALLELGSNYSKDIMFDINTIFFYWDGGITPTRMKILTDSIYSTRVWNPNKPIVLISNTIQQNELDSKFQIKVHKWDKSFFDGVPIPAEKVEKYMRTNPRDFSDLFRLVLLWQFGGSYIDTDDLGINPISNTPNLICRSYDPHTSFYNKIGDSQCVPGRVREIPGWENINTFPRNDCWQNWKPKSDFIWDLITNPKFIGNEEIVWIGGEFSWQSLTNETCINRISEWKAEWNYGLTLLYLFEDFVAHSSGWDRCAFGGEMCEIWKGLPGVNEQAWGEYKTDLQTAMGFYQTVTQQYPNLSHLWLHSKDQKVEWFEELDYSKTYSVSTWIYDFVKCKINEWK
jgi:hypothetical protein